MALMLVEEAAERIWTSKGRPALDYLRGRGLIDETIRAAGLGWTPRVSIPIRDGTRYWRVSGIVIPWVDRGRLAMVKIRRPPRSEPKYAEAYRDRPSIFPTPEAVRPGKPLVVCEGELDCLLLAQALGELAAVVTLGSASARPEGSTFLAMLPARVWYVATDADPAGDKAASGWPERSIRVRPPSGKDWTLAHQAGIDLRRCWIDRLDATEVPNPPGPAPWKVSPSGIVEPWAEPPLDDTTPAHDDYGPEDRAAIMEFDRGLTREAAQRAAGLNTPCCSI